VPHQLDVEVTQALRRYIISGELEPRNGERALGDLLDLPQHRHPHTILLTRAWELPRSVSACDAMYVALAEALVRR
jgi:predicted nucleic acid-binding protein